MEQPLVSVITYCFNGERFVHKYFDALLAQTYPNVELFFYNNGSADRTGEIAESYRTRLMDKGWTVNIAHFADNQVTCSLKQDALRRMHGDFFCGCDSDDVMYPEHISHMVQPYKEVEGMPALQRQPCNVYRRRSFRRSLRREATHRLPVV